MSERRPPSPSGAAGRACLRAPACSPALPRLRFGFWLLGCLLLPPSLFAGGTITNATFAELQAALQNGGNVLFSTGGSITFTSTITIRTSTVIDAQSRSVTFNGNQSVPLFNVSTGALLTLRNLILTRGAHQGTNGVAGANGQDGSSNGQNGKPGTDGEHAGGGAVYNAGVLVAENCSFLTNNATGGDGGDGGNGGDGDLTGGNGGDAGDAGAANGGAIYNLGSLLLTNCYFSDNEAIGGFGGTGGTNGAGTFISHRGHGGKGGLAWGGAIYNAGTATVFNTTFAYNVATGGDSSDGGASDNSAVGLDGRNGAEARGGALQNNGTLTLVNSTFANNDAVGANAGDGGPGSFTGGDGGNGGDAYGGGLCNNGTASLTNVTFAGGGVTAGEFGDPAAGGASGTDGEQRGANFANFGTLAVINTLFGAPFRGKNAHGSVTDLGHNLSSDDTPNLKGAGSLKKTDPKFVTTTNGSVVVTNIGGPTPTVQILSNSPAIDAGDASVNLLIDQRGAARPAGNGLDIGALEFGASLLRISGRLTEDTNPVPGFTVLAGTASAVTDTNGVFVFVNQLPGAYTVAPSDVGIGFTPSERTVTLGTSSVTNVDFTANAPRLQSGGLNAGGQFQLTGTGVPKRNYVVEASTNLTTWALVQTNLADDLGKLNFTDSGTTTNSQRFFRTRPQ